MCGIGGILSREPAGTSRPGAQRLLRALAHRGPDGQGIYESPDGRATLAHARLAILGPGPAGHQPMQRGNRWVTFNGEIYNFKAARDELIRDGENLATGTDTEVLLALYERHGGPGFLPHLRGMFALAVWDERERTCFLARDGFGIKPLYYTQTAGGGLIFSSEIRALMATGLLERAIDPAGLESYLAFGSVAEPRTMFAGVRCLEAGHWLRWRDGALESGRHFQATFDSASSKQSAPEEQTRQALIDSVRHHFVSDVPVGILLSGGMDSGALLALSRAAGRERVTTFSIGVEDASQDESEAARARAKSFGCDHHEMLLTRELAAQWVEPFLAAIDQPTVDGFNTYCSAKLAADLDYKVVLSGVGGDELFGGYPSFRDVPRLMKLGRALRPWRSITGLITAHGAKYARSGREARLAAYFDGDPTLDRAYETVRSLFSPRERDQIGRAVMGGAWCTKVETEPSDPIDTNHPGDEISNLELNRYLRNQLLRDADVMSMVHGVELRVPFLDQELFGSLRQIPSALRLQPAKGLLRKAVPEIQQVDEKRGFTLPFDAWLNTSWSGLRSELKQAPPIRLDTWARKWSLIVLSRWLRENRFPGWAG